MNKLTSTQEKDVCRNMISKKWIDDTLSTKSFGYAVMYNNGGDEGALSAPNGGGEGALSAPNGGGEGALSAPNGEGEGVLVPSVLGFVLCRISKIDISEAWIDLICIRPNTQLGSRLMNLAEATCIEQNISKIKLMSLSNNKLVKWYEKSGYIKEEISVYGLTSVKLYQMVKYI